MDERTLDTTPSGGGRLDGPPGRLDEVAAQRTKTRALVLQRRTAPGGRAARSRPAPAAVPPVSRDLLDAALGLVLTLAQTLVPGADGASLTLSRHGRLNTVAASDEEVLELDHEQNLSGAGPSLDASRGHRVHVESLRAASRWPAFARMARARGVETVLCTPLIAANRPIGALTLYSHTAGSFAAVEAAWAELFADEAATMVAAAQSGGSDTPAGQRIRDVLQSREAIAQAQGVIMQRDAVSAATAYAVLRDTSRRTDKPPSAVAAECVASIRDGAAPLADLPVSGTPATMAVRPGYVPTATAGGVADAVFAGLRRGAGMGRVPGRLVGRFALLRLLPRSAWRRLPA